VDLKNLLEHEDGFGSDFAIEVLWNELDLASSGIDIHSSVSVSASRNELLGTFASVGWACDDEFDALVFVDSVGPFADNRGGLSFTRNVFDSVELVWGGGEGGDS